MSNPAELLPWDSEFFGRRIARAAEEPLDAPRLAALDRWCEARRVDCLYLLADAGDRGTVELVQTAGFELVDVRLTLDCSAAGRTGAVAGADGVRRARQEDLPDLRPIARRGHTDSRFYFDSRFPESRCDDLYDHWLARSFEGWADAVLVADQAGSAAGYVTCHRGASGTGSIGLVGVGEAARGQGLGGRLVEAALAWFAGEGLTRVEVVTQGRNVAAQRLYQGHGFRTCRVGFWFHRWARHGVDEERT